MAVRQMLVAGRYRLCDPVGTGGMGRVWLARDEMLDRDVAVKEFVPPDWMTDDEKDRLRDRTLREARSAARLNHPHVVRIYDVVHAEGLPWIVMEYISSRSLYQVITEDGPFTPGDAARIGLDVLDALTAAHRAGVLHRDVKPHNVLIGVDGRVVLTDFGLATFVDDGSVTGPGLVVGSPQYVSPERARDGASTVESDLWSLGATLYAAVEGRSPYARDSAMATLMALATEPPDPAVLAGPLTPVLTGLLRHDAADRLTSAQVEEQLRAIVAPARTDDVAAGRSRGRAVVPAQRVAREGAVAVTPPLKEAQRDNLPKALAEAPGRHDPRNGAPVSIGEAGRRANLPPAAARPAASAPSRTAPPDPEPAVPVSVPPADLPRRSRSKALVGLLAFAVLAAGGVTAGYLLQRDDGPTRTAAPIASDGPAGGGAGNARPGPGGFSPLVCEGEPPAGARRTPQPGAARTIKGYELLPGFSAFTDDQLNFRIAVPDGWTYERTGKTVCFRDPGNIRILSVDTGRNPAGDPVQACRKEANRLRASGVLPAYEEKHIRPAALAIKAADWEYTYRGPEEVRMHATTRWFVSEGRGFALGWITRDFDWPQNLSTYGMIQSTFESTS
jgi:serine/threonine protein kinase